MELSTWRASVCPGVGVQCVRVCRCASGGSRLVRSFTVGGTFGG